MNLPSIPHESSSREWWHIFDPRRSLRARAAFIIGGASALFVAVTVWFSGSLFRRSLENQLGPSYETLAFQVSDKIDRVIYERQHQLQFLARLAAFRSMPSDETGVTQRRQLLEALQTESPDLAWIGFADSSGNITAATQKMFEGSAVPTRPWFRAARVNPFVGGPNEIPELPQAISASNDETQGRYLDLSVPVTGKDGRNLGVLGAHLRWSWTGDVTRSVVTEAANRNQIGVTIYSGSADVILDSGVSGWTIPPNAPPVPNPRTFRGSLIENFPLGTQYVTGFARSRGFREYRGLGWLIAVRQPTSRALEPVQELQRITTRWGIAFAAALTVSAWFFVAPLARRMKGIRLAANRIRSGDILTVMPSYHGEMEISEMSRALGELVKDFQEKKPEAAAEVSAPVTPRGEGNYVRPTGADPRRIVW